MLSNHGMIILGVIFEEKFHFHKNFKTPFFFSKELTRKRFRKQHQIFHKISKKKNQKYNFKMKCGMSKIELIKAAIF